MFLVTVTPETSMLLQNIVFSVGGSWASGKKSVGYLDRPLIEITKRKTMFCHTPAPPGCKEISLAEAIHFLYTGEHPKEKCKELEWGGYKIEINHKGNIKFGCTVIPKEIVDKIIELRNS